MKPKIDAINQLITSIYSTPLKSSEWFGVMNEMATVFDANAAILAFAELNGERQTTAGTRMTRWYDHNAGSENIQAYLNYASHDIRTAHGLSRPGRVYADHDFIDDQAIEKHVFYQEFLRPFDMCYSIGVAVPTSSSQAIVANIIRGSGQDHADRADLTLFNMLYPHIAQAVRIGDKLAQLQIENAALRDGFDRLADGIFMTSGDGTIILANRAAEAMLAAKDGLSQATGMLQASHRPSADALRDLLARTAGNGPGQTPQAEALPLPKPSGGRPLHLLAMPVVTSMDVEIDHLDGKPSVFIIVSDPDQQPTPPEERLRAIFGLTNAESRLASALVGGLSVADYAEETGITENTARWTLKQVQAKTDCRRQADLVRLLMATTKLA